MATFEHPSGNGHRECVGVPDLLGTLFLGGFYLVLRRAPWPALQNFLLGGGVIVLTLRIAERHIVLAVLFFYIFWQVLAVFSLHAMVTSYLRRGWKEVDPDDATPPRRDEPDAAFAALPPSQDVPPRPAPPAYGLAS